MLLPRARDLAAVRRSSRSHCPTCSLIGVKDTNPRRLHRRRVGSAAPPGTALLVAKQLTIPPLFVHISAPDERVYVRGRVDWRYHPDPGEQRRARAVRQRDQRPGLQRERPGRSSPHDPHRRLDRCARERQLRGSSERVPLGTGGSCSEESSRSASSSGGETSRQGSRRGTRPCAERLDAVRELLDRVALVLEDQELAAGCPSASSTAWMCSDSETRDARVVAAVLDEERRADRVDVRHRRRVEEEVAVVRERAVLALARGAAVVRRVLEEVTRLEMPTHSMPAAHRSGWKARAASTM